MNFSRRRLLQLSATTLLAHNLWPGSLFAADAKASDFTFICVNDLHLFDDKCRPWFEKVVAQMKQTPADLLLIVGDLADGGTAAQFAAVDDLLKPLGLPTYVTIGNHDYPSDTDRKAFEQRHPGRLNYTFEHRGWQFLGIDSTNGTKAQTTIVKESIQYLDDTLPKLDKSRPLVLFTHFPLGETVNMRAKNADDVLNRLKEYNLRAVFNGHYHAFTERKHPQFILTTDRCCSFKRGNHDGSKEKGYFVCQAKDGAIARTFVEVKPL